LTTNYNEGAIPTNPYQAAYTPFPSDIGNDGGGGFIAEDEEEENSEVKLWRKNIANEMWKSKGTPAQESWTRGW